MLTRLLSAVPAVVSLCYDRSGSFYLQSKVVRAKERLEEELGVTPEQQEELLRQYRERLQAEQQQRQQQDKPPEESPKSPEQ